MSIFLWRFKINIAFSAIIKFFGVIKIPNFVIFLISLMSAFGSITTPLPIIATFPFLKTPDGRRLKAIFFF